MNKTLERIYAATLELFKQDERVLGAWEYGSIGKGTHDELSDVDPVFLVRDEAFDQFDRDLPKIFAGLGCEIVTWWPEGFNNDTAKNYAIFIKADELLQYDMTFAKLSSLKEGWGKTLLVGCGDVEILFDKEGIIADALNTLKPPQYLADSLVWDIQRYWIYIYIIVKYLRREDIFKILYTQQILFGIHMNVLRELYPPQSNWSWWPWTAKHILNEQHQAAILLYFAGDDVDRVIRLLCQEMDLFSQDGRAACEKHHLVYPDNLEQEVRAHFTRFIPNN
jgi:hypothetical protein